MKNLTKRSIILVTIITLTVLIGVVSTSMAAWGTNYTAEGTTTYTYGCFNLSLTSGGNALSVSGYPVSDTEGLATTPYTFTIKNTCSVPAVYDIVLNEYSTTLPDAYVKVAYKEGATNKIYRFSELRTTEEKMSDAAIGKILATGVLNGGATKNYTIYSWIDEKAEADQITSGETVYTFTYKVSLNATSGNVLPSDSRSTLSESILASNEVKTPTPSNSDFAYSAPNTNRPANESGLFIAADDLGDSYYFRGNVTNNYVKFGKNSSGNDMYWRIVRINGDNSIRLIYDGTQAYTNGTSSTNRRVTTKAFNTTNNGHKYVGYTYDNTYDEEGYVIRGTDSTIKAYLENDWYRNNIINTGYDGYITEEIYCNDTTTSSGSATGTLYYGPSGRNRKKSGNAPILTCPTTDKTYGGKYKLKVGLISTDELVMAGFGYPSSAYYVGATGNYLSIGSWFWTGSPHYSFTSSAYVFDGFGDGFVDYGYTSLVGGVRPVINLRSDIRITSGNGTQSNPYEVAY